MRYIIFFIALACAFTLTAKPFAGESDVVLSQEEITHLVNKPEQLEATLSQLSYDAQTQSRAAVLKHLSVKTPTEIQRAWVDSQLISNLVIRRENPDHPEQLITLVDVAKAAKTTKFLWQVNTLAQTFLQKINANNWQWQRFDQQSKLANLALLQALNTLSDTVIEQLQLSIFQQGYLTSANNQLLAALTNKVPNLQLSQQLLANKADEFSYQHLANIHKQFDNPSAVALLAASTNNSALTSQSLMALSHHFVGSEKARAILINHLNSPKSAWLAASAISQSKDAELKRQVLALASSSSKPSNALAFIQQRLMEAE